MSEAWDALFQRRKQSLDAGPVVVRRATAAVLAARVFGVAYRATPGLFPGVILACTGFLLIAIAPASRSGAVNIKVSGSHMGAYSVQKRGLE